MGVIAQIVDDRLESARVDVRRDLHRHPELSGREERTAAVVAAFLDRAGVPCRRGVAGHGVVGDLPGPAGVPVVALRADMDALPIHEETGLEFASAAPRVMHACGHDGHTTTARARTRASTR